MLEVHGMLESQRSWSWRNRKTMPVVATLDVGAATHLPSWHTLSGAAELDELGSHELELVHPALCISRLDMTGQKLNYLAVSDLLIAWV